MPFTAPVAEQRFVLDHVARIGELAASERFTAASDDVVDAVLEGVGQFAAGEWAPLLREGDTAGPRWTEDGVKMPADFVKALGVALLVMVLDLLCAVIAVTLWSRLTGPHPALSPTDPQVIAVSSLSTRICGPILFALSVWLFSRNDAIGNVAVMIAAGLVFVLGNRAPDLIVAGVMAALFLTSATQFLGQAYAEWKHEREHQGHDHAHEGHRHGAHGHD